MPSVTVLGAAGYTGALAAQLLWRHPTFELKYLCARSDTGQRLDQLYPRYRVPLPLEPFEFERHTQVDAVVVAYPHGAASPVVAELTACDVKIVDLSADFRLRDLGTYQQWYGEHAAPALLSKAVYGLPELYREQIAAAKLIANPGCYPTAVLLALAPLARADLIAEVVIDAKSGVSGAGRKPTERTHFVSMDENIVPYGVEGHRHLPEIEQELAAIGSTTAVTFIPHLVPLDQGELVSCYVTPKRPCEATELHELYSQCYASEPFVRLCERPPAVRDVRDSNCCYLSVHVDQRTGKVVLFSVIDNLWKGAASQAVQNLNLMFSLPEGQGIE